MPQIHIKKINDIKIQPVPIKKPKIKSIGYDYFTEPFFNVFLLAKKNTGKTTVIYDLISHLLSIDLEQKVYFFVSTIHKDIIYEKMRDLLDRYEIEYECHDCLYDKEQKINFLKIVLDNIVVKDKENFSYPENIFIFDDLSDQLQNQYIHSLVKENRHYKSCCILSSQYLTDLSPASRSQLDYCLAFKNLSEDNLKRLYRSLDVAIEYELFEKLYKKATEGDHDFLYIDRAHNKFRFNFNYEINLNKFNK